MRGSSNLEEKEKNKTRTSVPPIPLKFLYTPGGYPCIQFLEFSKSPALFSIPWTLHDTLVGSEVDLPCNREKTHHWIVFLHWAINKCTSQCFFCFCFCLSIIYPMLFMRRLKYGFNSNANFREKKLKPIDCHHTNIFRAFEAVSQKASAQRLGV